MLMTDEFFRYPLDQLIDHRHPLALLANPIPRQEIAASLAHCLLAAEKARETMIELRCALLHPGVATPLLF
jgi:hypothetical protein